MRYYFVKHPVSFWEFANDTKAKDINPIPCLFNIFMLAIPRLLWFFIFLILTYIVSLLMSLYYLKFGTTKKDSYVQYTFYLIFAVFYRMSLFGFGINPFNYVIHNYNNDKDCPILISIHKAYSDGPFIGGVVKESYVIARYIYEMPILNNLFREMDFIPVDKADKQDRKESLHYLFKAVHSYYNNNNNKIVVYPEGMHGGEYLIPFKTGAFSPLVPMQIVYMEYCSDMLTGISPSSVRIPSEELLFMLARSFLILDIKYSDTIYPDTCIDYMNTNFEDIYSDILNNLDHYKKAAEIYKNKVTKIVEDFTGIQTFDHEIKLFDFYDMRGFYLYIYKNKLIQEFNQDRYKLIKQWIDKGRKSTHYNRVESTDPALVRSEEIIVNDVE